MNIADQDILIWVLRITSGLIIVFITIFTYTFMRRIHYIPVPKAKKYSPPKNITLPEKIIMLSALAKPGRFIESQKLFEALHKLGFKYSKNNIFEYILEDEKTIAFSVINHKRPHTFTKDYSQMRPTSGIFAILSLPILDGSNQSKYFYLLLSVLEELKGMLDLEICNDSKKPINDNIIYVLKKEVDEFERNYSNLIQNEFNNQNL